MPQNSNMLSPRRTFWILGLAALIAALAGLALRPREPVYEGKRLSEWLEGFSLYQREDTEEPEQKAKQAAEAVRRIGTNAIPHLVRLLRLRDSAAKQKLIRLAQRQSLVEITFTPATDYHHRATEAFRALGPAARSALPMLSQLLQDPATCQPTAIALAAIGPDGFPVLEAALAHQDATVQAEAIVGLASDRHHPRHVTPILIRQLKHPDTQVRYVAALTLGCESNAVPEVFSALMDAIHDPGPSVRALALQGLKHFPASSGSTIPVLLKGTEDPHFIVRWHALASLFALAPAEPEAVVPVLTDKLDTFNPLNRSMAARILAKYGARATAAVPTLVRLISSQGQDADAELKAALCAIDPATAAQMGITAEEAQAGLQSPSERR